VPQLAAGLLAARGHQVRDPLECDGSQVVGIISHGLYRLAEDDTGLD